MYKGVVCMRNAVVTGAGSGLGRELAIQYSKKGFHIFLLGRNVDNLSKTKACIEQDGGVSTIIQCDITNPTNVEETVNDIIKIGHVHKLVNNAGVGHFGPLDKMKMHNINTMIDTNVKGTIYVTQMLLPYMLKTNSSILNIISTAGLRGKVNEAVYCASKFAIRGFTESLIKEYEQQSIDITAVYMGGMDTPFWEGSDHIKDMSRLKAPYEIAKMIIEQDDGRAEIKL
jgi:uncharacterized protein